MTTKTINLYTYRELSPEAKKAAHKEYLEDDDASRLGMAHMSEMLHANLAEFLEDNKIKSVSKPIVLYSLNNCQGDGLCFTGEFTWKKYKVYITHGGQYYHSNSTSIDLQETDNLGFHMDEYVKAFDLIYQKICKKLEKYGYDYIDDERSEDTFADTAMNCDWLFTAEGEFTNLE